jgi:hypothetical protein
VRGGWCARPPTLSTAMPHRGAQGNGNVTLRCDSCPTGTGVAGRAVPAVPLMRLVSHQAAPGAGPGWPAAPGPGCDVAWGAAVAGARGWGQWRSGGRSRRMGPVAERWRERGRGKDAASCGCMPAATTADRTAAFQGFSWVQRLAGHLFHPRLPFRTASACGAGLHCAGTARGPEGYAEADPRARSDNERPLRNRLPASGFRTASTDHGFVRRHGRHHSHFSRRYGGAQRQLGLPRKRRGRSDWGRSDPGR